MKRWTPLALWATTSVAACTATPTVLRHDLERPKPEPSPAIWIKTVIHGPAQTRLILSGRSDEGASLTWFPDRSFLLVEGLAYPPAEWTGPTALPARETPLTLSFALDRRLTAPARITVAHSAGETSLLVPGSPGPASAPGAHQSGTGP